MLEDIYGKLNILTAARRDLSEGKNVWLTGCVRTQTEHLLCGFNEDFSRKLVVCEDEKTALDMLENYMAFDSAAAYYPVRDPMFYKADIRGSYISEQRLEVIKRLGDDAPFTVFTCREALSDRLASRKNIEENTIFIANSGMVNEKELAERLVNIGYDNVPLVSDRGEFSVRGNIFDIFPYGEDQPFRIDLWGDEVDSIKKFDLETQRSTENVNSFTIFPGADREKAEGSEVSFLSYFDPEDTLVVFNDPARLFETGENGAGGIDPDSEETIKSGTGRFRILCVSALDMQFDFPKTNRKYEVNARSIMSYNGRFQDLVDDLKKYRKNGWNVTLCCAAPSRAERMRTELRENDVYADVCTGSVKAGFEYPDIKEALISEVDIFGTARSKKRAKRKFTGDPITAFTDLNVGDYVVHEEHGIGVYQGITRIKVDDVEKDYMKIQYAGNSNLYVLATHFDRVQKYSGSESAKPKINKLGGKEWSNTRAKTKSAVRDIAAELVRLYAARQVKRGYQYSPDTVWQQEFEEQFEFEETDDQLKAIEDIKSDMESTKIMDRLICGDVGFGKTEVAIRAAFKAVQDGKQVAFLAPTTILAKQHYETICRRMANYPIVVKMLSRFTSQKEQKEITGDLKSGMADIVVGTHRLLSNDIGFRDLGLLIIDEEQRFGVAHKEKIKNLRKDVDVLALSATPIPRTLHMSLSGIRDMSLLTEPPKERVPIQTYVMEYSDMVVKEALLREAARGGQTYYVYNRIDNIAQITLRIRELAPSLNVRFAHGRMSSGELEDIMTDYINGDIDVLVSTTIIESGLDIPNVNTIIIHDADKYGLSQLYQLRGRVGRSDRTAYAFLMYRKDKQIKETAEKRLQAIRDFTDLGSGIKIAMRDLEIRGAGNVLGAEQSGHMDAVGYELYCKMLNEAVAALKGEITEEDFETSIELNVDGFIPADYISDEREKLNMYKKISVVKSADDASDVYDELLDRFGDVPAPVLNLLDVALIKAQAHSRYITEISGNNGVYRISMYKNARVDTYKMFGFLNSYGGALKFDADKGGRFTYTLPKAPKDFKEEKKALLGLITSMDEIMQGSDSAAGQALPVDNGDNF